MIVVAPTGVAAINAGGVTIHSFFQLDLAPHIPGSKVNESNKFSKEKRKIIASMDLLIIDELSHTEGGGAGDVYQKRCQREIFQRKDRTCRGPGREEHTGEMRRRGREYQSGIAGVGKREILG